MKFREGDMVEAIQKRRAEWANGMEKLDGSVYQMVQHRIAELEWVLGLLEALKAQAKTTEQSAKSMTHTNVSKHFLKCPYCKSIIKRTDWFNHRYSCLRKHSKV